MSLKPPISSEDLEARKLQVVRHCCLEKKLKHPVNVSLGWSHIPKELPFGDQKDRILHQAVKHNKEIS